MNKNITSYRHVPVFVSIYHFFIHPFDLDLHFPIHKMGMRFVSILFPNSHEESWGGVHC
jgi:hypothetical protein